MVCEKSQLSLEEEIKLLFFDGKPGCVAMLIWTYLDESADQNQQKAFVTAGFMGRPRDWSSLRRPWKLKLRQHGIRYFKSSECRNLQGEFRKFKTKFGLEEGKRQALLVRDDLERLIRSRTLIGFAVGTSLVDFHKINSLPEAKTSPHWNRDFEDATFQILLHNLIARLKHNFPPTFQIGFVHDESQKSEKLKTSYLLFKKRHPELGERMRNFTSHDDKTHPPLQVADLMADVARDVVNRKLDDESIDVTVRDGVKGSVFVVDCWQEWGMMKVLCGQALGLDISPSRL